METSQTSFQSSARYPEATSKKETLVEKEWRENKRKKRNMWWNKVSWIIEKLFEKFIVTQLVWRSLPLECVCLSKEKKNLNIHLREKKDLRTTHIGEFLFGSSDLYLFYSTEKEKGKGCRKWSFFTYLNITLHLRKYNRVQGWATSLFMK